MGNRTRTVNLEYIAKIDKLEAELSKLPGISEKEARGMVRGLNKELKRATKAAKRAARQQRAAFKKLGDTFEGTKRVADALGGSAAGAAGAVEHLGRSVLSIASALGPAGAAAAAAAIAIGGVATAGAAAALATGELVAELEAAGRAPVITDEQRDQVGIMDAAVQELKFSVKELVVAFGAEFAPAVTTVAVGLADAADAARGLVDTWGDLRDASTAVARPLTAITSLGLSEAMRAMAGDTAEYADQQARAAREAQRFAEDLRRVDGAIRTVEATEEAATGTTRARSAASIQAARDRARAEREAARAVAAAERETARAAAQAAKERQAAHMEMLARIEEREAAKAAAEAQRIAEAIERERELAAFREQQSAAVQANAFATASTIAAAVEDAAGRQTQATTDSVEARMESIEGLQARREELISDLEAATEKAEKYKLRLELTRVESSIAASEKRLKEEQKSMLSAFRLQKALAALSVVVNSAQALLAGYAQTGPPPLPGGIAVSIAVGAATTASLVAIAAQSTPSIAHDGAYISPGSDERQITARTGEAVLNQRAVEQMGGRAGVEAANRGQGQGGAYVVAIDGRTVAAGVAERVRGIVVDELASMGSAVGFTPIYGG